MIYSSRIEVAHRHHCINFVLLLPHYSFYNNFFSYKNVIRSKRSEKERKKARTIRTKWLKRRSETPKATANRTTNHIKLPKKAKHETSEKNHKLLACLANANKHFICGFYGGGLFTNIYLSIWMCCVSLAWSDGIPCRRSFFSSADDAEVLPFYSVSDRNLIESKMVRLARIRRFHGKGTHRANRQNDWTALSNTY